MGVIFEDIRDDLESFSNFNQFFTRQVNDRLITYGSDILLAPADSKVISINKIIGNDVIIAKNITYSIGNFLTGKFKEDFSQEQVDLLKKQKLTDLYSIIFYLAPHDYHRFHSMANMVVTKRVHIAGELYTVKDDFVFSYSVLAS